MYLGKLRYFVIYDFLWNFSVFAIHSILHLYEFTPGLEDTFLFLLVCWIKNCSILSCKRALLLGEKYATFFEEECSHLSYLIGEHLSPGEFLQFLPKCKLQKCLFGWIWRRKNTWLGFLNGSSVGLSCLAKQSLCKEGSHPQVDLLHVRSG